MKVKIKTWKQMEAEFGLDGGGDIRCKPGFVVEMEAEMPKNRVVEIEKDDEWNGWTISADMIAKVIEL